MLPHVVFNSTSFPWVRSPTTSPPTLPAPGEDTEADVPTWLAVLVLDDDDAQPPGLNLEPVTMVVGDLFPPAVYQAKHARRELQLLHRRKDNAGLETDGTPADPVQTIDLPLKLFADLAPTLADLR